MELHGRHRNARHRHAQHRHTALALALLLWGGFLAGCATFSGSSEEGPSADTRAVASDSLDSARPDSARTDTSLANAQDSLTSDTLAADSLADAASGTDTIPERPTLSNDSLRQLTPQDTIPSGEPSTTSNQRVRVRADSLTERRGEDNQRIQELLGNVRVRQDSTRLRSLEAIRFLESDEFLFSGDVVIYERGDTLRSTRVRYDRPSKVGRAFGAVHLSDGDVDVYSTRAVYYSEEKRSVFPDSVLLVDEDRTLTAASGVYYSEDQRAEFFGDVQVRDPDTYMEADSVRYFRNQDRTEARGNVFIDRNPRVARGLERLLRFNQMLIADPEERLDLDSSLAISGRLDSMQADTMQADTMQADTMQADTMQADTTDTGEDAGEENVREGEGEQTLLWGDRAENDEDRKSSRVTGRALLLQVRADSAGDPTDTLLVRSHRLDASRSDTLDRMIATDSVRIWQPNLAATADSVVYDRFYADASPAAASTAADSTANDSLSANAQADSIAADTTSTGGISGEQKDPTVGDRRASASEEDVPRREETRLFQSPLAWFDGSQVKGDTIRVVVRNRSVDTVFVRSSAFAAQYDSVSTRVQQLTGALITAVFRRDSIRTIIAQPNARAIRFLTGSDGDPNGAAKTSSDRIVLRFKNDEVERVSVLGGTETTYYKQAIVPDPFQLEGYIWTPDAKPEKPDFFQDLRVRERLNLPPLPESPDTPETVLPDSVTPDSVTPDSVTPDSAGVSADSAVARSAPDGDIDAGTQTRGPTETDGEREASNAVDAAESESAETSSPRRVEPMPARRDTSASSPR